MIVDAPQYTDADLEPLVNARSKGFDLKQIELDTGQVVWQWWHPDGLPQPRFLTRREAMRYFAAALSDWHEPSARDEASAAQA